MELVVKYFEAKGFNVISNKNEIFEVTDNTVLIESKNRIRFIELLITFYMCDFEEVEIVIDEMLDKVPFDFFCNGYHRDYFEVVEERFNNSILETFVYNFEVTK